MESQILSQLELHFALILAKMAKEQSVPTLMWRYSYKQGDLYTCLELLNQIEFFSKVDNYIISLFWVFLESTKFENLHSSCSRYSQNQTELGN